MMSGVRLDINYALKRQDGNGGALFETAQLAALAGEVDDAARKIERERARPELAFLELPYAYRSAGHPRFGKQLHEAKCIIDSAAEEIRSVSGHFVHLAIGGSALGSIMLCDALCDREWRERIHVPDN